METSSSPDRPKYVHEERIHNLEGPSVLVPEILKVTGAKSVVDIGCGTGTFLHCCKQAGVTDVLGVDGSWVNRAMLSQHLKPAEFLEADLEKPLILKRRYDLVISLEVAEHLSKIAVDVFIQSLLSAGEVIAFSCAVPNQGGQNHINEQWPSYWQAKFAEHNYVLRDVFRACLWNKKDIPFWYRQNIFLITPTHYELPTGLASLPALDIIHPVLFESRANDHRINADLSQKLLEGRQGPSTYARLFVKSWLRKLSVLK